MPDQTFTAGQILTASQQSALQTNIGLTFVKSQTVGTGVSSVIVTDAFSATYDAYKVIYANGTNSTAAYLGVQLRTGTSTSTTSYYHSFSGAPYAGGAVSSAGTNNGSSFEYMGYGFGTGEWATLNFEIINPFLARKTVVSNTGALSNQPMFGGGVHTQAVSYDQFVVTPSAGTLTGGTITVYGYRKA